MEGFSPLLILLFFWVLIGLPASIAKKAAKQNGQFRTAAPKAPAEEKPAAAPKPAVKERLTTLTPSVSVTGHDDSVYQGSMNAVTGEGYDPCHEEQMLPLTLAEEHEYTPRAQNARAALPLGWTDNDVVRGIVMSEILNRKH